MVDPADARRDKKHEAQVTPKSPAVNPDTPLHVRPLVLSKDDLHLNSKNDYDDDDDDGRGAASSKRTRRLQGIERRVSKALHRVARAAEHGTSEYIDARDRSEDRRKDGALVDLYENIARGVSKAVSEASPALVDVAKAYNTKESRRQMRSLLKGLPRLPFIG
jgi:hypothetical protein